MSDAVMQAKVKAFDEFSQQFRKFQQELRALNRTQKETQDQNKRTNESYNELLRTIGDVGAIYVMQQALQDVMATGRQFELTIKQAQAVTGDFSRTLRDLAMHTKGDKMDVHTPTQLAEAYRELGAAGASTNEIMAATPDIMEFGVASMLQTEQAAYGTLATIKSFNLGLEESGRVVDAYTEAMNLGALAGEDFRWIMSSAGAVANMAGQEFEQILSIGSAMRDAGVQAQDAGTSIRSALMHLMNPTKEVSDIISQLGIEIYDSSGRMKQWSDIVKEFEETLKPYNEQSKQMILSTIFGSDGIRAMAISLSKGSDYLDEFTNGLKNSEGATHRMAEAMAETFDGALRRVNSNLERTKILLFEDFAQDAVPLLDVFNSMLIGFNNLNEDARTMIEIMVGAGGLVFAMGAVANAARALGIAITLQTGVVGIGIAGFAAMAGALMYYNGEAAVALDRHMANAQAAKSEMEQIERLTKEFEELNGIQKPTNEEQERLRQVTQDITDIMPAAISGFDEAGNRLATLQSVTGAAADEMARLKTEMATQAQLAGAIAQAKYDSLKDRYEQLEIEAKVATRVISGGNYGDLRSVLGTKYKRYEHLGIDFGWLNEKELAIKKAGQILDDYESVAKQFHDAEAAIAAADAAKRGDFGTKPSSSKDVPVGGGITWTPPPTDQAKNAAKKAAEAARMYIETVQAVLYPYERALQAAGNAVDGLSAKEQYLNQVMQAGQGTAYQAVELNKVRTEQFAALNRQQTALHKLADEERAQLALLEKQLKSANNPEVIKTLRDEIVRLNQDIADAGEQWWQVENKKFQISESIKVAEQRRWDDAYQAAMDRMRHEVTMTRMSTDQQIYYLEKLRDAHQWTQSQMWDLEENLFRLRRQQLDTYYSRLESEYKTALDALDDRTKESMRLIQEQLDALDDDDKNADREEAQYQHNQKLAELEEQKRYHELRTGKEHEEAIKQIEEQIAEEKRRWEQQQQEWARDDQRESLQQQLEDVRENAQEERDELQDHYEQAREIASDGIMDVIAALAATAPEWLDTGKQLIDQLIEGLESGDFSAVTDKINEIRTGTSPESPMEPTLPGSGTTGGGADNPLFTIGAGQYINIGGKAAMWSQELGNLLGIPVAWNSTTGQVKMGDQSYTPLKLEDGRSYVGIREVAEALGYMVGWDPNNKDVKIYRAALGGIFTEPALTQIAEGGYAEAVLPLPKLQPMINDAVKYAMATQSQSFDVDKLVTALERVAAAGGNITVQGPLYHSDATYMGDEITPEITGRQLLKGLQSAARGRGYRR